MRGEGAILKDIRGNEFMKDYHPQKDLAPRDVVSRAIDAELKKSGDDYVYLDIYSYKDSTFIKKHYPGIYERCLEYNINITKEPIPVVPAAHYLCGGIKVNENGRTWIKRLYAAGETASTGMHGANRLASNSLIEAIVYADRAAQDAKEQIKNIEIQKNIPDWDDKGTTHPEEMVLITQNYKEVQQIFSVYVGIVRSNLRLKRALDRLEIIYKETEQLYWKSKLSKQL